MEAILQIIWEMIKSNGLSVVVILMLGGGSLAIPATRKMIWKMVVSLFSEKVIKAVILEIAEKLVKDTKTKVDDKWLEVFKENL